MANHQHSHSHEHHRSGEAGKNITLAFFLNFTFCIIELIGGLLTNSVAILSDALHDLGDSVALGLAWIFQKTSDRKPNAQYTYGYKRFSLLSAMINSIILLSGSVFVVYESMQRIITPPETVNAKGMFLLAILGVIVNGAAILRLKKGSSLNERVVSLHLLEDVFGWIAVLIVSIVMMIVNLPILDPILSIAISAYILYNVYKNMKMILHVILQRKPENVDENEISNALAGIPEVKEIHDLHIWTMDSEYNVLTVHLVLSEQQTIKQQQRVRSDAHRVLKELGIQHSTIEMEYENETCEWCLISK